MFLLTLHVSIVDIVQPGEYYFKKSSQDTGVSSQKKHTTKHEGPRCPLVYNHQWGIDYRPIDKPVGEETDFILYKQNEPEQPPVYPKSVVKTTRGRVVGEYYYDATSYKNKRHYIFNSKFFLEQLSYSLNALKIAHNDEVYGELLQMLQDACKRIAENPSMHFEIATNGLLNDKTLKELWQQIKSKNYREAAQFAKRLNAKIAALGANYRPILKEQMTRYSEP